MNNITLDSERKENAIAFMLFRAFGITDGGTSWDTIPAAIDRAFKDSTDGFLSFVSNKKQEEANCLAKELINDYIKELRKCQCVYDTWHKQLCDALIELYGKYRYKKGYNFTYGIAQKWVNMTMKYLYFIFFFLDACGHDYTPYKKEYGPMINKYIPDFHIPVDNNSIQAAETDFGVAGRFESWDKIDNYDDYYDFQTKLKSRDEFRDDSDYSPIDWWAGPTEIDIIMRTI